MNPWGSAWRGAAAACLLLTACDATIGNGAGSGSGPGQAESLVCQNPNAIALGSSPLRRLTNVEYENTVRDLLGGDLPGLPAQPSDAVLEGTFENDARSLGPSDVRIARYEAAATLLGEHAVTDPTARARVLPCATEDSSCGRTFVEAFGKRAFRRPLTDGELDRWAAYFELQRTAIDFDAAVQLTVSAMLQTPQFLYRLENDGAPFGSEHAELTQHELASRLSYFLWETMPDDALIAAADRGELRTGDELESQARRLLADPRARAAVRNFHRQWLHLDRVLGEDKLPELFPSWSLQARASAKEETLRFVEATFFGEGTVEDLLTSPIAYVDDVMAELYGVEAPAEPWSRVELDSTERAGILSRVAFLAGNAHEANGSPPLRGIYVMERLLCEPRPSPPADADLSPPMAEPGQGPVTNRQLFEQRVAPSNCQGCHVRIDGFGYGFEQYDAAGRFRIEESGLPIDASGYATGIGNDGEYDGAVELQALLAESEVVQACIARQWYSYARGRPVETEDGCQLEGIRASFAQSGGRLDELLLAIVMRPEFRLTGRGEN